MVRLWWLWWPQLTRPPPQRWRQAAEHSEAPPRGGSVVAVGDGLVAWRGCRRLCRGGGGGTRLVEMEVMVASNEDDSEGSGGGVVMMGKRRGRGLKQREAWQRRGCAAAVTRSVMENDDDGSGALAGKFFRRPENAMEAPDF
ncbi:hypothetical protein Tco_0103319 [Tanacetum coccineum]